MTRLAPMNSTVNLYIFGVAPDTPPKRRDHDRLPGRGADQWAGVLLVRPRSPVVQDQCGGVR